MYNLSTNLLRITYKSHIQLYPCLETTQQLEGTYGNDKFSANFKHSKFLDTNIDKLLITWIKRTVTWQNQQSKWAPSEDSDQLGHPDAQADLSPKLIWVFAGCSLTLLVLSCRGSNCPHQHFYLPLPALIGVLCLFRDTGGRKPKYLERN